MTDEVPPTIENVTPSPVRRRLTDYWRAALGVVAAVWSFAFVLYFWHREGLVSLSFLFSQDNVRPAFRAVLGSVFLPWHVWWNNVPWLWMMFCTFMIAVYWALGRILLDCFRVTFPRHTRFFLSLALGMGAAGIVFEGLAMAGRMGRLEVFAGWAGMFAFAGILHRFLGRSCVTAEEEIVATEPDGMTDSVLWRLSAGMIGIISALMVWHGIASPETYWDSLILYMGYARKMFLLEGFPFKAVGQVGIGLGANYPHQVAVLSATTAKMAGQWNDIVCQLLPPVLSIGWIVFVYATVMCMMRDRLVAVSAALLVRSVPYGLCYSQFASDYAFAVFYTAAFLYVSVLYVRRALPGLLVLAMVLAAIAMHINYLMGVLYFTGLFLLAASHLGNYYDGRVPFAGLLRSPWFIASVLFSIALAVPWYVRNWVLTGNPVYAFFPGIFGGVRINPEVMASAVVEWKLNGDGLARVGVTLWQKICGSWEFFVTGPQHWKLQPILMGFVIPGLVLWVCLMVSAVRRAAAVRYAAVAFALFAVLVFYAYCVADYYLYQIIIILPLFGIFSAFWLGLSRRAMAVAVLLIGFAPGILMGMMGFKLKTSGALAGQPYGQHLLTALRNPFMDRDIFLRMVYDGDMEMFDKLAKLPTGTVILTHENRHLLLNEKLHIMHLDDWEPQSAYGKPIADRVEVLDREGVEYYLYVPNEDKHRANSRLGMDELIGDGWFQEVWRTKSEGGSTREGLEYRHIPADVNVLYKRTAKASRVVKQVLIHEEDFVRQH